MATAASLPVPRVARFSMRLVPTLPDLFFPILLAAWFGRPAVWQGLLGDGDTGWHIRTGEILLQTGRVPAHDPFSFWRAGERWYAWEWLSDAIFAELHRRGGLEAVAALAAVAVCLWAALLLAWLLDRGAGAWISLGVTLAAVSASSIHFLARPHIFSLLLLGPALWTIDRGQRARTPWRGGEALRTAGGAFRPGHFGQPVWLATAPAHSELFEFAVDSGARGGVSIAAHPLGEHAGLRRAAVRGGRAGSAAMAAHALVRERPGDLLGLRSAAIGASHPVVHGGGGAGDCFGLRRLVAATGRAGGQAVRHADSVGSCVRYGPARAPHGVAAGAGRAGPRGGAAANRAGRLRRSALSGRGSGAQRGVVDRRGPVAAARAGAGPVGRLPDLSFIPASARVLRRPQRFLRPGCGGRLPDAARGRPGLAASDGAVWLLGSAAAARLAARPHPRTRTGLARGVSRRAGGAARKDGPMKAAARMTVAEWRTHSSAPRRHSCRRHTPPECREESRHGTHECVRHLTGRG